MELLRVFFFSDGPGLIGNQILHFQKSGIFLFKMPESGTEAIEGDLPGFKSAIEAQFFIPQIDEFPGMDVQHDGTRQKIQIRLAYPLREAKVRGTHGNGNPRK